MEYLIRGETLAGIADEVRRLSGTEEALAPDEMKEALAAVQAGGSSEKIAAIADGSITELTVEDFGDITSIVRNFCCYNEHLVSVAIPNSVTTLGITSFYNCNNLKHVTIPFGLIYSTNTFGSCNNVETVTFTLGTGQINDNSASNRPPFINAQTVILPNGITRIGNYALYQYAKLTSISIPEGVTEIGEFAFSTCSNLSDIVLPTTVNKIGQKAFVGNAFTSFVIPSGVVTIENYTFSACKQMTNITIPKTVTSIIDAAFINCTALTDIYYEGTEEEWANITIGSTNNDYLINATIHYNTPM